MPTTRTALEILVDFKLMVAAEITGNSRLPNYLTAPEALQELSNMVDSIIGDTEPEPLGEHWDTYYVKGKNNLRAEQRKRKQEYGL